ncbi:MAG: helix-turn-helix domain-containing protein [Alphaproteobacteria bacterium]|nr:helix-turn-helix domain-containing protein [Alphaproteobacteria bacterium]
MPRPKQKSLTLLPPAAPKFKADTSWFHVFRDFVHSGACARLGPHAATVLLVIKSFTDFETGESIPSIDTIVEKAGISRRQVILSLAELEKAGYLVRIKDGRSNSYRVRE